MAYGTDEIANALYNWDNQSKDKKIIASIKKITDTVTNWDDLWISYAVSSLEIEIISFYGKSNIEILERYLSNEKINLDDNFDIKKVDEISLKISTKWKETTIPLSSVSDKILYIRDLIYLKLIYNRINK